MVGHATLRVAAPASWRFVWLKNLPANKIAPLRRSGAKKRSEEKFLEYKPGGKSEKEAAIARPPEEKSRGREFPPRPRLHGVVSVASVSRMQITCIPGRGVSRAARCPRSGPAGHSTR